jgi:hypothetical protein
MKLTKDEIEAIEQAADALKKWQDYVAETHSDGLGCCISLRHALETRVDKLVDILLAEKPALGQNIKKEYDKLLKDAELVDALYEQNVADARVKEAELLGTARRLISRLQQIARGAREELVAEKPAKPDSPQSRFGFHSKCNE